MQQKETFNPARFTDLSAVPGTGRLIGLDPGTKRIGVAVCDEMRLTTRSLPHIVRTSWKKLLVEIKNIIAEFDAKALVIGLPLNSDGTESDMSREARNMARKFTLSLEIPVFLQDERVTSYEAKSRLWERGTSVTDTQNLVDSEAASIILADFIDRLNDLSR